MILSMSEQAVSFLFAVAAGALLGNFYDFFRVFRRIVRHKTAATTIEDAVFWITATLLTFLLLLYENSGEIRGFTFLGVTLGAVLYFCTLSRAFVRTVTAALNRLKRVIRAFTAPIADAVKKRLNCTKKHVIMKRKSIRKRLKRRSRYAEQTHQNQQN